MKKLATFILLVALVSCGEDFVTIEPQGTALEANFYQTEDEMFQGLVAVYDVLSWGGTAGWSMTLGLANAASDDCFAGGSARSDQFNWVAWDEFSPLTGEIGPQFGLWEKYYRGVALANLIIIKASQAEDMDPDFLARVIDEAKFLRAHFYFDLVKTFGNVVLSDKIISLSEILELTQSPSSTVYDFIEEDLLTALNSVHIPDVTPASELGRVNKNVISALMGKVILYRGDESRFLEAASYFENVIDSGQYDLEDDFERIFAFDNEWGRESIWEFQHSEDAAGGWDRFANGTEGNYTTQFNGMRDYLGPTSSQYDGANFATGWSFNPVSPDLVDFMINDPRYQHTIIDGNRLKNLGASYTEGYQNTDYFVRKYAPIEEFKASDGEPAINWGNNERVIRLADVLLMTAECLVRGGGDEAMARSHVNRVRSRVSLQPISNSGESLLTAIYKERRMELATEGHRFFDLVRTGQAADVLDGFVAGKHEYLPIPQREIDLTQGSLVQNPGY